MTPINDATGSVLNLVTGSGDFSWKKDSFPYMMLKACGLFFLQSYNSCIIKLTMYRKINRWVISQSETIWAQRGCIPTSNCNVGTGEFKNLSKQRLNVNAYAPE